MPSKTIRFPDELAARVQEFADREDRSFSYVVTKAVESFFGPHVIPASSRAPVEKESVTEAAFAEDPGVSSGRLPAPSRQASSKEFQGLRNIAEQAGIPEPPPKRPAHLQNFQRAKDLR